MSKFDILKGDKTPDVYDTRTELHGIVNRSSFDFISAVNKVTQRILAEEWVANIKANKRFWRKHQPLRSAVGLGINKAVIGIGASPSFNKNKNIMASYVLPDGLRDWPDRDFITMVANHQFKPLLEMGVIPDFVILVDGSDVVYDQLCKDIPSIGRHTILITGVHASPKVIREWTKQGRHILFYLTCEPNCQEAFRKHMKRNPDNHKIELGGNVMNGAWMIGAAVFKSTVFMGIGNDLSFPIADTIEEQRENYYADGDYSTNAKDTGTGRDEAATHRRWAGFTLTKRNVLSPKEALKGTDRYNIELDIVGTSKTLWVYKTWLESTIMGQTNAPARLHYFNCTEGGILGVMAKDDSDKALKDPKNWYMLDQVCKNKHTGAGMYHTAMLQDTIEHFLTAKETMRWQESTQNDVLCAMASGRRSMADIVANANTRVT
uniref:6-hydroxymethylpterin diphosphokinase MptE-like domain-containing protein n=1 Tax=viral metagenome TaxID=1070528 RepID=A0A6M3XQD6_9ZZZZ